MKKLLLFFLIALPFGGFAQKKSIEAFTAGFDKLDGFFPIYLDNASDKIYLEVNKTGVEFLYYTSLARGVGSNDIGLDRGRLGQEHVLTFQQFGNKLLLTEPNYAYRANSDDILERKAVEESFAKSVHFGFEILAQTNQSYLIDITGFVMRDAVDAVKAIAETKQGNFVFDASKSALYRPMTKNFPKNTEIETLITLTTNGDPGNYLREVAPTPTLISMHQHHSFVELPDVAGYDMREFDPRIGYGGISYFDYASPISEPIEKRYTSRHRLHKKDPNAVVSEAVEPIIYYMDRGAPEPIRTALMEGAAWWNQAFTSAGYKDAFQVKLLPEDADPMDVRYNVIQWVHRSTRGWSYGASIIDPRTGEILKGKITLGSLRVRQDFLIAQGLVGDFETDTSHVAEINAMALSRLRQLAAHEVGHTLGLPHNYIASAEGRASVMDYPHPLVEEKNGKINLDYAYTNEIGEYDKTSIQWGYQDFPAGVDKKAALENIVQHLFNKKLQFLTDQDARPVGSIHPQTHLWDNGESATDELNRVISIRKSVLQNFDERKIRKGEPMASLEEVFVPMYMFHRFQLEAAAKVIGGAYYTNALKGDNQPVFQPAAAQEQQRALAALLATLQSNFLEVPPKVLSLIPPRPFRYSPNEREVFQRKTGLSFDPLAPPTAAATLTLNYLLHPQRVNRLEIQPVYDNTLPSLKIVLDEIYRNFILKSNIEKPVTNKTYYDLINENTAELYVNKLFETLNSPDVIPSAKATIKAQLTQIQTFFKTHPSLTSTSSFGIYLVDKIAMGTENPAELKFPQPVKIPDGQPIGGFLNYLEAACSWTDL